MKYIYFDCYAGFDVQMALGSLIDMSGEADLARETAEKIIEPVSLYNEQVKRQGMDALLSYFDFSYSKCEKTAELIENSFLDEKLKTKLKSWYKLKSDGKSGNEIEDTRELLMAAAGFAIIGSLEAEKIYVSALFQGGGGDFSPSPHTELIGKMSELPIYPSAEQKEILTPGGIAFLSVLGAEYMSPQSHDVIKSGYGAGDDELSIPNIVRAILANDDGTEELFLNFEALISDMQAEIGAIATAGDK
ncbi:MAG: DUF111 family protein [Clostridia bacterium]|nr:DUF111 family protein [Clostridia bacterium]